MSWFWYDLLRYRLIRVLLNRDLYVCSALSKTAAAGMSASAREPIRRQFKSLYDEAAENAPPPWAQPEPQKPGFSQ